MKSILEEMYRGKSFPFGELNIVSAEYEKARNKLCDVKSEILEKFPEVRELLYKYQDAEYEVNNIAFYRQFEIGFKAGAQIMLEATKPI